MAGKRPQPLIDDLEFDDAPQSAQADDIEFEDAPKPVIAQAAQAVSAGAPSAKKPSAMASFGRGVAEGGTFGFVDELGGALGSLFAPKSNVKLGAAAQPAQDDTPALRALKQDALEKQTAFDKERERLGSYTHLRDRVREGGDEARAANPKAFFAGELTGGVAATAPLAPAATLGKAAAFGAGQGAVAGLGNSRAELTNPTLGDVARAAGDTALGAGFGAAGGVVGYGIGKGISYGAKKLADRAKGKVIEEIVPEDMDTAAPINAEVDKIKTKHLDLENKNRQQYNADKAKYETDLADYQKSTEQAENLNRENYRKTKLEPFEKAKAEREQALKAKAEWESQQPQRARAVGEKADKIEADLDASLAKQKQELLKAASELQKRRMAEHTSKKAQALKDEDALAKAAIARAKARDLEKGKPGKPGVADALEEQAKVMEERLPKQVQGKTAAEIGNLVNRSANLKTMDKPMPPEMSALWNQYVENSPDAVQKLLDSNPEQLAEGFKKELQAKINVVKARASAAREAQAPSEADKLKAKYEEQKAARLERRADPDVREAATQETYAAAGPSSMTYGELGRANDDFARLMRNDPSVAPTQEFKTIGDVLRHKEAREAEALLRARQAAEATRKAKATNPADPDATPPQGFRQVMSEELEGTLGRGPKEPQPLGVGAERGGPKFREQAEWQSATPEDVANFELPPEPAPLPPYEPIKPSPPPVPLEDYVPLKLPTNQEAAAETIKAKGQLLPNADDFEARFKARIKDAGALPSLKKVWGSLKSSDKGVPSAVASAVDSPAVQYRAFTALEKLLNETGQKAATTYGVRKQRQGDEELEKVLEQVLEKMKKP